MPGDFNNNGMASMVEVMLDQETFSTLCRRGRKRLRDIQTSCQALLQLDRNRRVLYVTGSPESIARVRNEVAGLGGPSKFVSSAVWAELMRTRILQDGSAVLSHIQQESGCRIHIERRQQEVRLFGPPEATSVADSLLDDFANTVREEPVPMEQITVSETVLQSVAHACGVTLRVEEDAVVVLGLHAHVKSAVKELNQHASHAASSPTKLIENDQSKPEAPQPKTTSLSQVARTDVPMVSQKSMLSKPQPQRTYGVPPTQASTQQRSQTSRHQTGSRHHHNEEHQKHGKCCPTCGCGSFCGSCGVPVAPAWGYMQAAQMSPYMDMSQAGGMQFIPVMMQAGEAQDGSNQGQMMFQMFMPQQSQQSGMDEAQFSSSGGGKGMMPACFMQMPQL